MDYFEVVNKLAKRFDIKDLPETIQMQFTCATQNQTEILVEWSDRVVNMAMQAYSELADHQVYKQAIFRFCQGCLDKEAGLYALNQKPQSIEEAIDRVSWFQHTSQAIYGRAKREIRSVQEEIDPEIRVARSFQNSDRKMNKSPRFKDPRKMLPQKSKLDFKNLKIIQHWSLE